MMNLKNRFQPGLFSIFVTPGTILIDQASKLLIENNLIYQSLWPAIPFVSFYRTYNDGIAFSLLDGLPKWILLLIATSVLILVSHLWHSTPKDRTLTRLGFAFIWGGAVGNIIDRSIYGYVIDFILVHTQNWSFAIFNLADSFITIGAGLVILDELIIRHHTNKI